METKYRTYCDTSIFGGVFDREFSEASNRFFRMVTEDKLQLVISPVVGREVYHRDTPAEVKKLYDDYFYKCEIAEITKEVLALQEAYIKENILSLKWEDDALQ